MIAILSDIHGNLEALDAVLRDIQTRKVEEIICLGDVVGYGPNPIECLDRTLSFSVVLMGNHEEALLGEAKDFNLRARAALDWTREKIEEASTGTRSAEILAFLRNMPHTLKRDNLHFVHGSPLEPTRGYLFPKDLLQDEKMRMVFEQFDSVAFVGHTHVPGIFTSDHVYASPYEYYHVYMLEQGIKALINVGSVGQPRDGDPRASYATFDGDTVVFRKVEYDFAATMKKILEIPALDRFLAERLKEGK